MLTAEVNGRKVPAEDGNQIIAGVNLKQGVTGLAKGWMTRGVRAAEK